MTTMKDIVTRALRKIGVGAQGEELQAFDLNDGLEALNAMLYAWKLDGINLEYTELEATDAFPLAPEFEEGTAYVLAGRLSADYETPMMFDADAWFRKIQAAYMVIDDVPMPRAMLRLPSTRFRGFS